VEDFQVREERCVIADLIGKGKHIRTVPVPAWVKRTLDAWTVTAEISAGTIFRRVNRMGKLWGDGLTPKAIWHVVKAAAQRAGIKNLAPHDLRRTCARLCHLAGGELEQIQFLLGHASVQTTERYLGCKQKFASIKDAGGKGFTIVPLDDVNIIQSFCSVAPQYPKRWQSPA
jgi:site-specific recombinase XerD